MFFATHASLDDCQGPEQKQMCFLSEISPETQYNEPLLVEDGTKLFFQNANEPPLEFSSHEQSGEFGIYNNDGYYRSFTPSTTVEEYSEVMRNSNGVFFGAGTRAITLTFTVYSKRTDWWVNA